MIEIKPEDLLEPAKVYQSQLKQAYHDNAVNYFKEMTEKSKVNTEENKELVKKRNAAEKALNDRAKLLKKAKRLKGFLLFLVILLFVAIIGIVLLCTAYKSQKAKVKALESDVSKAEANLKAAEQACYDSLASLYNLFDYNMAVDIFTGTTPLINLDKTFDPSKFSKLRDMYGLTEYEGDDISTLGVQSGSILGNPFLIQRYKKQTMVPHVYTGTLTITWTESRRDSNGHYYTTTRTQVLTATVTEPEPAYNNETILIYGNEAAPDLSFSRAPDEKVSAMDDKQLQKYCVKFDKELDKKVQKDVLKNGGGFTALANTAFEALFHALDRNNETQFRLLFTPLAQRNIMGLLQNRDGSGFGDDFSFRKNKKLNYIFAGHLQASDLTCTDPKLFMHYDYEVAQKTFIDFIDSYVKKLFFALAPLLCIPLYQQHKSHDYIYKNDYAGNVTRDEVESSANQWNYKFFKHPKAVTDQILRSNFVSREGKTDNVSIRAYSFEGIPRVTLVPKLGGDGKWHNVPVNWIEYKKVSKDTPFRVQEVDMSYSDYRSGKFNDSIAKFANPDNIIYRKRFISSLDTK